MILMIRALQHFLLLAAWDLGLLSDGGRVTWVFKMLRPVRTFRITTARLAHDWMRFVGCLDPGIVRP